MEVSAEKSKVMVNSSTNASADITMNGQKLEKVEAFKYLGATLTKDGRSSMEVKIRLATATAAMAKLEKIWRNKSISLPTKIKLYRSLVLSILLYGCESLTLSADLEKKLQAFEMKCYRKLLRISGYNTRPMSMFERQLKSSLDTRNPF